MSEHSTWVPAVPHRSEIAMLGGAIVAGVALGVVAKLMGLAGTPVVMLGQGVALWVTAGFLLARRAAKGRGFVDAVVWAGTTMAVYLSVWLLAYTAVYGLQDPGGFGVAWLNERIFFILTPPVAAVIGSVAAISWREGPLGDMACAAPAAWALPEAVHGVVLGWQYAAIVSLPSVLIGLVPILARRDRQVSWVAFAVACVGGGAVALALMRVVTGRM